MPHPLKEVMGVREVESEPDAVALLLGDARLLLLTPLPLCVPEVHTDAVPGCPSAAAPPE